MPKKTKEARRDTQVNVSMNGKPDLDEEKLALVKAKKEEVEKVGGFAAWWLSKHLGTIRVIRNFNKTVHLHQ